ncbi:MAG: U32 family peptidase [Bacteroidales bacterium]|nr:U32 family peptidase [Bacteroidales bacterium]
MQYLHRHRVRGFVTLNTLIFSDELPDVAEFVRQIAQAGVDAVIVQDLGLVALVRRLAPTLPVHASTQMTLTESRGVDFAHRLGIARVVLARELSLEDIRKVTATTETPVEVFIHGALCVAYSGQCLTSEALGGRSANRGQCAQACRLPYEMIVDGHVRDLGDRAYLLSPQDLAAYEKIGELIAARVASFKIEGRLKGGPYVAATTQTYRQAIDTALAGAEFTLSRREQLDLAQTFSRGLTTGFLQGVDHQKLVRGRFPKSRGVRIGNVVALERGGVTIRLAETVPDLVKAGDGVVFDLGRPEEKEPGGRVWGVLSSRSAHCVTLQFERHALDFASIPIGCDVWKTDDPALRKRLEQSYAQDRITRKHPLHAHLSGTLSGAVTLTLTMENATPVTVTWPGPLELARTRPTGTEEIREQLARLGDTPFTLESLTVDLPTAVLLPRSVLNDLRRRAVEALGDRPSHPLAPGETLAELRQAARTFPDTAQTAKESSKESSEEPGLTVLVRSLTQLDAVLSWSPPPGLPRPHAVYCDFEDLRLYKDAVPRARTAGVTIGLAALRIVKPGEDGFHAPIVRAAPDRVLVRNLGEIDFFRQALPQCQLVGDYSLNIANELTAAVLFREGLMRLVPSFDLSWDQFQAVLMQSFPERFEPVVHQQMPMFHMEHCVFAAFLSQGKDHRDCGRPCETHRVELRDRTGAEFPVHPDTGCRNTVFNAVAQSAAEYIGRMRGLGVGTFRVDLLRETESQVQDLLTQYARVVAGLDDGRQTWRQLRAVHQLGLTRGTLQMAT